MGDAQATAKEVFAKVDQKAFGWFHIKMIIIAGAGFFTDAYDLFSISLLTRLIGRLYFQDDPAVFGKVNPGKLPIGIDCAISSVALVGTLCGQLFIGYLGDKLGRKTVYGIALSIMISAALCQAMSFGTTANGVVGTLCMWRFILGFGVGGDYPLSATIMSEYSSVMSRGAYIGSVFAMQGMGILAAAAVTAIIAAIFSAAYPAGPYPWNGPGDMFGTGAVYTGGAFYTSSLGVETASATAPRVFDNTLVPSAYWSGNIGSVSYKQGMYPDASGSSYVSFGKGCVLNNGALWLADSAGAASSTACPSFMGVSSNAVCTTWDLCPADVKKAYIEAIKKSCPPEYDYVWRIVLAFGAIPALLTLYYRFKMAETPRYTVHVDQASARAKADLEIVEKKLEQNDQTSTFGSKEVVYKRSKLSLSGFISKYWKTLLGASMSWCLLDVAFYSQNLFQKDVFTQIGWLPPAKFMSAIDETGSLAKAQALIALGSTIPGYWFTVFFVDRMGRIPIQFMGFTIMTALMAALAGTYWQLLAPNQLTTNRIDASGLNSLQPNARNGWIAMYAFTFFFANFGPNSTTFIIPAELFPTEWRSTGHGFCAALGKLGAIIGAFGFLYAAQPAPGEVTWDYPCSESYGQIVHQTYTKGIQPPAVTGASATAQLWTGKVFKYLVPGLTGTTYQFGPAQSLVKPYVDYSYVDAAGTAYVSVGQQGSCQTVNNCPAGRTTWSGYYYTSSTVYSGVAQLSDCTYDSANDISLFPTYAGTTLISAGVYHKFSCKNSPAMLSPTTSIKVGAPSGNADVPGLLGCDYCIPGVLSGCYPYGIGVPGALGILAGINFLGMLFTLLVPETNQKSLEELNEDDELKTEYSEVNNDVAPGDVELSNQA
jgi:MFS family permease